jgi:PBP1b-binding outer membrane lipoprotein LpoB
MGKLGRNMTLAGLALAMASCAPVDDTIGSHLVQPPPNTPPRTPVDAGDIAIVGQEVSHSIMDLPAIADASVPPLVQFNGVTSIIAPPIDTTPYTELLRDRLLLLTREKLRFQEHTLPPLVVGKKKSKKAEDAAPEESSEVDYQILAEMRGRADDDVYKIQVQFIDIHTSEVLFDGLYTIRKEDSEGSSAPSDNSQPPPAPEQQVQPPPQQPAMSPTL